MRFKSHNTVSLFLHVLPNILYSHLSRAMWEYTFWSIAESISPISTKSHTVKLQISCSVSVTASLSSQIFSAGTEFDLTLYSANLSFCQHWINHGQILSRPCLCFRGGAGSRGPQWPRQHPPFPPLRLFHGGAGFGGCAARASPPSTSLRPRTS